MELWESDNFEKGGTKPNLEDDFCISHKEGLMEEWSCLGGFPLSSHDEMSKYWLENIVEYRGMSKYWLGRLMWHYAPQRQMVVVVSNVSHKNSRQCGELLMRAAKHRASLMKRTIWEPLSLKNLPLGDFQQCKCGVVLASSKSDNTCIHSLNFFVQEKKRVNTM